MSARERNGYKEGVGAFSNDLIQEELKVKKWIFEFSGNLL